MTWRWLGEGGSGAVRLAADPAGHVGHLGGAEEEERMMGLEPTTFCMASRRSSQLSYIRPAGRSIAAAS